MISALLNAAPWLAAAAFLLWLFSLRSNNVSHVDILWPLLHVMACASFIVQSDNLTLRACILLLIVTTWGVRLATHLAARAAGRGEDRRYAEIRARQGTSFRYTSLGIIFLMQALLALVISGVFYPIITSQAPWGWLDSVLFGAALVGLVYEVIADLQLAAFLHRLKTPDQRATRVLQTGLWKYSRHPNYFGEWLFWLALALVALSLGSWVGLLSQAIVTWLLLRFTGVARMEQRTPTLRPEYRDYQNQTPAFLPNFLHPRRWFKAAKKPQSQHLLLAAMCAAALFQWKPVAAEPLADLPSYEHWHFTAFIDDKEVGYHRFEVRRDGPLVFLNSSANFEYRLWKVPLFSYAHEVSETYDENLCLQQIDSSTVTRKANLALSGKKIKTGFALDSDKTVVLTEDCLTTFAYWSQEFLNREKLLNGQDGDLMAVQISNLATSGVDSSQRYRLQAGTIDLTLTYSANGHWQGLESALPAGRTLFYKLESYRNSRQQDALASRTNTP